MNNQEESNSSSQHEHEHEHEHDMVMPGFRFHPTEEELVEFYLRRKVEGKCFNVELITFLYLYRYDPWELPGLAAMGGKEWYFYVPRDRKYRNGDRPNRVTTSGYWKATGADRMIRSESRRPIGLKKTLVFYSGKAPKGIRTGWIMNEYRLPLHETQRLQKAEISLCRVYKRAGVEDHRTRGSSSSSCRRFEGVDGGSTSSTPSRRFEGVDGGSTSSTTLSNHTFINPTSLPLQDDHTMALLQPNIDTFDDLHFSKHAYDATSSLPNHLYYPTDFLPYLQPQPPPEKASANISSPAALLDRLMWDWSGSNLFK